MGTIDKRKEEFLGTIYVTNKSGRCSIIDYKGYSEVTVAFENPYCIVKCQLGQLRRGQVKNPLIPSFYDKGYIGDGKYGKRDLDAFNLWLHVLMRAYDKNFHVRNPTYSSTKICDEWLNFQNFAAWCYDQEFFGAKDSKGNKFQLDKDILVRGNKLYSPETCCFVPQEVNVLLVSNGKNRGEYPVGVTYCGRIKKFKATLSYQGTSLYLGSFKTSIEAFQAYKRVKESCIKETADKWKNHIDSKVYETLMNWEIKIDD